MQPRFQLRCITYVITNNCYNKAYSIRRIHICKQHSTLCYINLCSQALRNMDYAPTSFWRWLNEATVESLKDAKEAIEREIQKREDQEKQVFLQFWKDNPVPCNRRCRHHIGDQQCPMPCAHTSTDPDQWLHHSANEWHRCAAHWFM